MKKKETFCPGCHTRDKRAPPFVPDRRSRLGNRDNSGFPTGTNQRFCSSGPGSARTGSRPPPGGAMARHRQSQGGASASMHSPTVKGARTEDLREELNRRHAAEDTRVSIERAHNRRLNAEGRNLGANLEAAAPSAPGDARARTGTPVAGVGCAALAEYLRVATWPSKFRPHLPEKFDGTTNPSEFLQVYVTAITAAGGDEAVMASYFHVALTGPARTWLMNLTPRSIRS